MGLGLALMEETQFDERTGRIMNPILAEYHVPVHLDVPEIDVIWTDIPDPHAPMGARGIGEIGITGVGAAVANADLQRHRQARARSADHARQAAVGPMNWVQVRRPLGRAFLASAVECVEAATIVLAVGTVRGWRSALAGTFLGPARPGRGRSRCSDPALSDVPKRALQLALGMLLLLFGMRWLRKAILRAAGVIALHDEETVFRSETANLRSAQPPQRSRRRPGGHRHRVQGGAAGGR